jgi:hypothetical protein
MWCADGYLMKIDFLARRVLWTELNDLSYLPKVFKEPYINCLGFVLNVGGYYRGLASILEDLMEQTSSTQVQDLGSGSATHIRAVLKSWPSQKQPPKVVISDLNPCLPIFKRLAKQFPNVQATLQSVNMATAKILPGSTVILCSCFHHLSDKEAHNALRNIGKQASAVLIIEPIERTALYFLKHLLLLIPSVVLGMLTPLFHRWSIQNFLFCTVFPVAPLMVQVDCLISILRSFRFEEIKDLLSQSGFEAQVRGYAVTGVKRARRVDVKAA